MNETMRQVALPPDPMLIARALVGRPGLAVLASAAGSGARQGDARFSFVACDPIDASGELVPGVSGVAGAAAGFEGLPAAPRWIGAIPYDAFRHLERRVLASRDGRVVGSMAAPRWHRYDAVLRIDHATGRVSIEADDAAAAHRLLDAATNTRALGRAEPRAVSLVAADHEPAARHEARIRAALDYIARGDVYQVNLARRLSFRVDAPAVSASASAEATAGPTFDVFERLFGKARAPYGVYWAMDDETVVCGASPELALEVRRDTVRTGPIKGTRPRGTCAATDEAMRRELEASDKERAELVMAVDLHRNDLGRVATFGSVRVLGEPRTLAGATVLSRVAEVVARRDVSGDLSSVAAAVLPCGSVTGAPKVRAMEIIAELEAHRRGLYTGALGYVGRDGALVLAMAIRTAVLSRRDGTRSPWMAEYFAGGGIVSGSDARREVEETEWKASHLS